MGRDKTVSKMERAYRGLRMSRGRAGKVLRWLRTTNKEGWSDREALMAGEVSGYVESALRCLDMAEGFLSGLMTTFKSKR